MKLKLLTACATAVGLMVASGANATIATVFDGITAGVADFDATVTGAGGTVDVDVWTGLVGGLSIDRGDYVITNNDGAFVGVTSYGSMSGQVVGIDPAGGGSNPRTNPMDYFDSGLTLTFDNPVNSVGFEVGDWATCCFDPLTELFISFDGGAPILVAGANQSSDGLFPSQNNPNSQVWEIFVAAFDDTGDFTEVSFWGNGIGEFLVAGGQVRYALIDQGTLPPTPTVPLPAAAWLLMAGLGSLGVARMKRR